MKRLLVIMVSLIMVTALIFSGCSSSTSSTTSSQPPTSTAPSSTAPTSTSTSVVSTTSTTTKTTNSPTTAKSSTSTTPVSTEPIKIGLSAPLSGMYAASAPYFVTGVQMVVDNINAAGGLLGRKVELVKRDNAADPSVQVQACTQLSNEGCIAIIGTLLDSTDAVLVQYALNNKIPIFTSSPGLVLRSTSFNKYSFHPTPVTSAITNAFAKWISQQSVNSVYYLGADLAFCHEIHDQFWSSIQTNKLSVKNVGETFVSPMETDFSSLISMVVQKKPDVLLQGIGGPPYAAFVQQAQQFNLFSKIKVLGTYCMTADTTESFGLNYPQGITSSTWGPFYINTPAMNDFTQAFLKASGGVHPGDITMTFMLPALALAAAIQQAGSTDADKLSSALEQVQFDSPIGKITVADFDHQFYTPTWVVTSTNSPDWPLAVGTNIMAFGNDIYPNKDQILAIRAGK